MLIILDINEAYAVATFYIPVIDRICLLF